jgi:RNA polymerase sigma factor (sigma-70 family)
MLLQQPGVYDQISRVVHNITNDPNEFEDLFQEAWLKFWVSERQSPHRNLSWYLQACRQAILEYLRRGRSLDSPKHRNSGSQLEGELEGCPAPGSDVLQGVCAHDDFPLLAEHLKPRERAVLSLLANSAATRQCGLELGISKQAVSKIVRHIRLLATRLGVAL